MEPIGFTIGVIGLAGLYSVCLQGLEQIDSGRNLGKESQKILVLFETEKFLLRKWGEKVGVIIRDGGKAGNRHPALDDVKSRSVAYNILANIESIWSDGDTLSKKYGLKMATQPTSSITMKSAGLRVQETAARTQKEMSLFRKCTWVIKNEKKFELLVEDLGAFVEKLYAVVAPEDGNEQVVTDVAGKLDEMKSSVEDGARDRAQEMMERLRFQCGVKQYLEDQKRRKLLKWIKAVSTEEEYDEALRERHKGTCSWIFGNDKFLDWRGPILGAGTPGVLWIHGKPGTGKTFLSASIIEFLKQHSSCPVAYFFCTHEDVTKNNTLSILRSWIFQLATERRDALRVIESLKRGDLVESLLWQIFTEIIGHMRCYLVVDGFDECLDYNPTKRARQAGEMGRFLRSLLLSIESTKAKVLIMSRNEPTIRSGLTNAGGVPHVLNEYAILPEDTLQDIQSFARKIVDSIKIKNQTARDNICHQLSTSCEGMFLWVRLEGDRLEPGMTTSELRDALSSMPSGLYHAYERDLERISSLSKEKQDRTREILRWVLFATRPLSVKELFHILAIKDGDKTLRSDNIPNPIDHDCIQYRILQLCGSLIEVRKNAFPSGSIGDNTIHFVHFSAKEFLLRARDECDESLASFFFPTPELNHSILAKSCLSYLLLSLETPESVGHAFTDYAAMNWTVHIRLSTRDGKSEHLDLQKKFFTPGLAFDRWMKKAGPAYVSSTPLASACWYGLSDISKQLLMDPNTNPNELTEYYGTPLAIASLCGYETVVQQLLSRDDVDVNLGDCIGQTPLYLAARDGHGAVVRQLLARKDLDPNRSERQEQWSPLYRAVTSGYEEIVQQILAKDDVDVNLADISGRTPLYIAARDGHEEIVKHLLVREGLDVNRCEYEEQWSPLYRAVLSGHEGIVRKLLINNGIDVNLADSSGRTPLYIAAREGYEEIVEKLLAREELDVNCAEDEEQWTPLYRAVSSGYGEIVQQILERDDIDVNLADSTGRTPLYIAARDGHEEIAKQLLAREDVKVNCCEAEGWTPLHIAVSSGYGAVVQKLLAKDGVDVNFGDSIGRTPLYIAARSGYGKVVEQLLAREELDVNRSADEGWTPLYRAVLSGYWAIVRQLLGREDIDINLADSSGRTPLYIAARGGHEGIVQQLLARKELDANRSEDEAQWTPLYRATLSGQEGIVRQLLAREDVNVDLVNSSGQTALSAAARYPEIAKLLRERKRPSGIW